MVLIDDQKKSLPVPVNATAPATNEKTQGSSTPYSPDQKELNLPPALPEVKLKL